MKTQKLTKAEAGKLGAKASEKGKRQAKMVRTVTYMVNPKQCKHCDNELPYEKRHNTFCNRSCSSAYNNVKSPKRQKLWLNTCKVCKESTKNKVYCSKACQDQENLNRVLSGKASSDKCRRYLIEQHGEQCMKCGWAEVNPVTSNVPIELEHKDGNYENNNLDNLELLCPNCHSLTPTYKALNTGNGRTRRMEKYYSLKT